MSQSHFSVSGTIFEALLREESYF